MGEHQVKKTPILTVTLPKSAEAQNSAKTITVQGGVTVRSSL
jgi:hypothetical protein